MICVIDAGLGNVRAICNMLARIGADVCASADLSRISAADKLILPGVGAFDRGIANLRSQGVLDAVADRVLRSRVPILGVCLGMHFMSQGSEEGGKPGLGWFASKAVHLRKFASASADTIRVPHMGWSYLSPTSTEHPLLKGLSFDSRFYFAHSFALDCGTTHALACSEYAGLRFASMIGRDNIAGVQFHPEKSHRFGMQLLRNFAEWQPGGH
jgi:imidazole glycerol-phosphate synthase subunit HisH